MRILVNKVHYPVTVLGPGRRLGIWVQGCSIHCAGCLSRDTWEPDPNRAVDTDVLLQACRALTDDRLEGVTISGGEPFDQPDALAALLVGLRGWSASRSEAFDILCYSGYPLRVLQGRFPQLLAQLDALISEPFIERLQTRELWRGSENQRLVLLTSLARRRYDQAMRGAENGNRSFQVSVAGGSIWYIGIPQRGDLAALRALAERRGVRQEAVSWRA